MLSVLVIVMSAALQNLPVQLLLDGVRRAGRHLRQLRQDRLVQPQSRTKLAKFSEKDKFVTNVVKLISYLLITSVMS